MRVGLGIQQLRLRPLWEHEQEAGLKEEQQGLQNPWVKCSFLLMHACRAEVTLHVPCMGGPDAVSASWLWPGIALAVVGIGGRARGE